MLLAELVIGIVMAEVLHDLGRIRYVLSGLMTSTSTIVNLPAFLVELTGKTVDAAQSSLAQASTMVMRNVQNDVVNQAWTNLQEAVIVIDRNTLAVV